MNETIEQGIETQRDWRRLTEEFSEESDRAAALVAAALLDKNLEDLLRVYLIDDAQEVERMLGGGLRTLGGRVRAAYCLGLISEDECRDIRVIRDVRNHMAHNLHVSFADPVVKRSCRKLRLARKVLGDREMSHRRRLEQTACMLSVLLVQRLDEVGAERLQPRPEMSDLDVRGRCPMLPNGD